MFKHLNQSLTEAFKIFEDDIEDTEIVEEPVEVEQEEVVEVPSDSLEERVSELENELDALKDSLVNQDVIDDFDASSEAKISYEEEFANKVYECFMKQSGLYKKPDVEITEELLNKRPYCDAFIPSVAAKTRISRNEVKNILLNRSKGSGNEDKDK